MLGVRLTGLYVENISGRGEQDQEEAGGPGGFSRRLGAQWETRTDKHPAQVTRLDLLLKERSH